MKGRSMIKLEGGERKVGNTKFSDMQSERRALNENLFIEDNKETTK